MVHAGLGGINTTIAMETGKQPHNQQDGVHYIKPLQHTMMGFENFDPATEEKSACHPNFLAFASKWAYCEERGLGNYRFLLLALCGGLHH